MYSSLDSIKTLSMKRVIFFALIVLLAACTSSPNLPATDTNPPATPSKIKALAGNAQVTVTWQANSESDLKQYTVYWGSVANNLADSVLVEKTASSKTIPGLTNDTTYFFAVSAEDTSGNASKLSEPVAVTPTAKTDSTPPAIISSSPAHNATNVLGEFVFSITFSEPMDTGSLIFNLSPNQYALELITWSENDTVLTLSPLQLHMFSETTTYTLTLNAKDRAGNALGDKTISFTTGVDVPRVVSSTPASGATNIPLDLGTVSLKFSAPVDTTTFTLETTFPNEGNDWTEQDTQLSIYVASLDDESTYTVSFDGKDKQGRAFSGSLSFSTIPDSGSPHVKSTSPQDGAVNVPLIMPTGGIGIYFDDVMDKASAIAAVSSSLPLNCTWEFNDGLECLNPSLAENTTYILTVDTTAKDTSGNPLSRQLCRGSFPCAYSFKFSTGSTIDETRPIIDTDLSEPDTGETGVALNSTINVIFSEKMNEASVERVFRTDVGDFEIAGTFGWFNSGMVFFPSSPLPACTNIHVTISSEATDRALNTLASPYDITFKTVCN